MPVPEAEPNRSLLRFAEARIGEAWPSFQARITLLEERQLRLIAWLLAAEAMAAEYHLEREISGLVHLMFGLAGETRSLRISAFVLPASFENAPPAGRSSVLVSDEFDRPVEVSIRVAPWELTQHSPINLRYATLACWVKPAAGGEGLLTVRHAARQGIVDLDDGRAAPVLWYAPECLDAVVAEEPSSEPLSALATVVAVAEDSVEAVTKRGPEWRTVSDIGQSFGTSTAALPHYFLLDQPLQPGDSGSLVRLSGQGFGLGLYIGSLATPEGPRGLCQGLDQLGRLFRLEGRSSGFYEH
jgi:hypothetical protein